MEPEDLHYTLEDIEKLEEIISEKGELQFGDPGFVEYNKLVNSVKILSLDDLRDYHRFLLEKYIVERQEEIDEIKEQAEEEKQKKIGKLRGQLEEDLNIKTLDSLRRICSPCAYSQIESVVDRVFYEQNSKPRNETNNYQDNHISK